MSIKNNTTSLQNLLEMVNNLPNVNEGGSGIELPKLANEGSALDLLSGKELIDSAGNKVTGTFSIDNELSEQDDLIAQIQSVIDTLPEAGGNAESVFLQSKTVTPTTSVQNVIPDDDYDGLSKVTVNAIPNTYVQPKFTKGTTIYTPTTSHQFIAAGTYCTGMQTIEGDANLVADNIKSGVSIFGVSGSYEGSGSSDGGSESNEVCPSLTVISNDVRCDDIFIPQLDGTYKLDQVPMRYGFTLYNVPINKPIILFLYSNFEPAVRDYTNLSILYNGANSNLTFIIKCNSTSPATLELYDND